ncbi:MAG: RsmB/NOP family class I SAM-dependent RNA methyltransferase [Candidatus Aenigmarchaeota archaeon]|nr:RsmB/NOP family class I SAM-dependent RNA methyltransferase [Candidatus Aenigmarchaeota archaeon]
MDLPARFRDRYGPLVDDPGALFSSLATPVPKAFRVNTLKATPAEVADRFQGYGLALRPVEWSPEAFVSVPEAGRTLDHFLGAIYLQELVSMLPPLVAGVSPRTRTVIDACAAPGSKTTQCAALMANQGLLVANDVDYRRIRALKFNLEKTGAINTIITNKDVRHFPGLPADVVLVDAPCSAEGTFRKSPEALATWSTQGIARHANLQRQLILKGFDLLAPGGTLVYSTCTFAPEENEAVIDYLLRNRPAALESIRLPGFRFSPPVREWNGRAFDPQVRRAARVWPHENDTGGFFLAKIRA